jgi:hypothetical protein
MALALHAAPRWWEGFCGQIYQSAMMCFRRDEFEFMFLT